MTAPNRKAPCWINVPMLPPAKAKMTITLSIDNVATTPSLRYGIRLLDQSGREDHIMGMGVSSHYGTEDREELLTAIEMDIRKMLDASSSPF